MNILGLSTLGDDCAVTISASGEIVAAASEASLRGAWMAGEFPYQAVETVLRAARLDTFQIDAVAFARYQRDSRLRPLHRQFFADWNFMARTQPAARRPSAQPIDGMLRSLKTRAPGRSTNADVARLKAPLLQRAVLGAAACEGWLGEVATAIPIATWLDSGRKNKQHIAAPNLLAGLCEFGWGDKLAYIDAQRAVEATAFSSSGFDRALVVNFAGDGFDATTTISIADEHGLRTIDALERPFSLHGFTDTLTVALGWNRQRGPHWAADLAAHGDPSLLQDVIRACIVWNGHLPAWRASNYAHLAWRLLNQFSAADVAAAWQAVMFETVQRWLEFHLSGTEFRHVVISGELPASLGLESHLRAGNDVAVYVDARSLTYAESIGAAALRTRELGGSVKKLERNTAGPYFTARELQGVLSNCSLRSTWSNDIEADIARLLANGHSVARFAPGANTTRFPASQACVLLGAASLAARTCLMRQLDRPAFLGMTSAIRVEDARRSAVPDATVVVESAPESKDRYPAAIEPDGKSLLRFVSRDGDGSFHQLLSTYQAVSRRNLLLMTDLALGSEPSVSLPRDAMRVFEAAKIDYLALGNFLVEGRHVAPALS